MDESKEEILAGKPGKNEFLIVGVGASAGGVEALTQFFEQVTPDGGMAYVVILHLSPDFDSQLSQILAGVTLLPVTQVTERISIQPNHVYVVSPNQHLIMEDGHIAVSPNMRLEDRRAPVDIFFRSLGDTYGSRSVGVILSGTGANGSMGIKRIKERGGATFVQNPREAAFNEMPRNAIATNLIDAILPVADIPKRIVAFAQSIGKVQIALEITSRPEDDQQALREIFTMMRMRTGHDFSNYKRPTLLRRIERRINVNDLSSLSAYADFLRHNVDEATALLKDLLISVTNFFRDRKAFETIESTILPRIIQEKAADSSIRIWVIGCATGEEAYSLAMLCAERTIGVIDAPNVQIFATDIDENAIATARDGLYSINDAADISQERLRRFFTKEGDNYRIRREIREMVLFANHNVLKDPPFSHLDLVTCRNMMIYLNGVAQERVLETVHFALKPGGYLFLGTSESADGAADLYLAANREHHIYQSRAVAPRSYPVPDSVPPLHHVRLKEPENISETETRSAQRMNYADLHQQLLEQYAAPSLVVNEEYDIVHLSERAGKYLQIMGGEPSKNLLKLIRSELRLELRTAFYQAVQRKANVEAKGLKVRVNDTTETINIHVRPVLREGDTTKGFLLVLFEPASEEQQPEERIYTSDIPVVHHLEEELIRVKTQLRTTIEQHEIGAEELKASNEELQAMNEELRSAAEELETSKEELQSINEELTTVNQELKVKVEETTLSNNNFQNLINSTDIATIFLDRSFRISMYTPPAREIFNVIPADFGRPVSDITNKLDYPGLLHDAEMVLDKLVMIEHEVRTTGGDIYLMRALPYRTDEDRINGVVITFINITERKKSEEAMRKSEERLQLATRAAKMGTFVYYPAEDRGEPDEQMLSLFGLPQNGVVNLNEALTHIIHPDDRERYANQVKKALDPNGDGKLDSEIRIVHPDGSVYWINVTAQTHFGRDHQNGVKMPGVAFDITERKKAEKALQESEERKTFLLKLSDAVRFVSDPKETLTIVSQTAMEFFRADRCYYCEIENNNAIIQMDARREDLPSVTGVYDMSHMPVFRAFMQTGESLIVSDTYKTDLLDTDLKELCIQMQIISFINLPIIKNKQLVGRFCITQTEPRHWTELEIELAKETAERTWAAVERARAEEALRQREKELVKVQEIGNIGGVDVDVTSNLTGERSPEYRHLHGLLPGVTSETHEDWKNRVHPDDRNKAEQTLFDALTGTGNSYESEYRIIRPNDGQIRWIYAKLDIERDENGVATRLVGVHIDITQRRLAEEALRESEERYRIALDAGELATWDWNVKNNSIVWNEQHFRLFGIEEQPDRVTPDFFLNFVYPEDRAIVEQQLSQALGEKGVYKAEFRIMRENDKQLRWMSGYGRVTQRSKSGRATRLSGVMFDNTERREAKDNLEATQNVLNTALEAVRMGVWSIDIATGHVNRSVRHDQLLGFTEWQEEWNPEKAKEHILEKDKFKFDEAYKNLFTEGVFQLEARVKHSNGSVCWIHYYGRMFTDENGKPETAAGVILDITDHKTIEKQKDEFIGIASHELKTPVTSIKAYAEILQEMFLEVNDTRSANLMSKLDQQVDRLTKLIRDLLDVTKVAEGQLQLNRESFSLKELIINTVEEMQRTSRQHTLELNLFDLPVYTGDNDRLGQVLTNLLSNAIKYSPKANKVIIDTWMEDGTIRISVQDFGIGMSEGTIARLFERFFRSEEMEIRSFPGLGLGLFISAAIMKQHGGRIEVKSEKGKGSVFTMILPTM